MARPVFFFGGGEVGGGDFGGDGGNLGILGDGFCTLLKLVKRETQAKTSHPSLAHGRLRLSGQPKGNGWKRKKFIPFLN